MPGRSVFVVDDEASICAVVEAALTDEGCSVRTFLDPHEALTAFRAGDIPDVALVDLWMNDIGGEEFCREIQRLGVPTRCIVMSGANEAPAAAEALGLRLVRKPFDINKLIDAVLHPDAPDDGHA